MAQDEELLARWQAGDSDAGQGLARRYFPIVRSYFRVKAPAEYQELVARTFLRLVEKRDKYQGKTSFRAFVLSIARMVLFESLRAKRRDERFDPLVSTAHDLGGVGVSTLLTKRQELVILIDALRQLPLAQQELLELYYCQQLTAAEIASLLDWREPTVRTRIRRALLELGDKYRAIEAGARVEPPGESELGAWMHELGEL